jgi:hypothetical protein
VILAVDLGSGGCCGTHAARGGGGGGQRRPVEPAAELAGVHPISSVRPRFGTRPSPTHSGERGEAVQGLNEAARVTAAAPRRPWRAAQGRCAAGSATTRFARVKREDEVPHLAVKPWETKRVTERQR